MISALLGKLNPVSQLEHRERGSPDCEVWNPRAFMPGRMSNQTGLNAPKLIPSDDILLSIGDRLVVLATMEGLRAVEQGCNIAPKTWKIKIEQALTPDAAFEGANIIVRISGYQLSLARNLMNQLPTTLPVALYKHQAYRLVEELRRSRVFAHILSPDSSSS